MARGRRIGGLNSLALREQEILNILYMQESCSAKEIQDCIEDDLDNATVRTILRTLESKGYVLHEKQGRKFIYSPILTRDDAANTVFDKLVKTFFSGSVTEAVATFIDAKSKNMTDEELNSLMQLIEKSKSREER